MYRIINSTIILPSIFYISQCKYTVCAFVLFMYIGLLVMQNGWNILPA